MKILLVGMTRIMARTICDLAEVEGIEAINAKDYREAVRAFNKGVDGIVTDAFFREVWNQGVGDTFPWGLLLQDQAASKSIPCVFVVKHGSNWYGSDPDFQKHARERWVKAYFKQFGKTCPPMIEVRQDGGNKRDHKAVYQLLRRQMRS